MYIRLGLCSAYSLLYGVHKPEALLDRAVSYGLNTVAICDIDNLYGLHSFLEAADERGINAIIGAKLTIPNSPQNLCCFVENRDGFGRLCEILTERNKEAKSFDPLPHLIENSVGLVLASSNREVLKSLAGKVNRLYAAITADDISVLRAYKAMSLPLAFLDTSVFLEKEDFAVHKVLRAIALNKTIGNLKDQDTATEGCALFKTSVELQRQLDSWPEAEKGTREIAQICQFKKINDGLIFPSHVKNPGKELKRRVYKGALLRYRELDDCVSNRIEYELGIIEEMQFSSYFLKIDDLVKMASAENRTCGRGSGAASIVSYALGITNVEPIRHNLYFERFLNKSRPDPPDIDIDFAWDERDDLIKAVIERFGPEYCARVANHNFFRSRSALRETAKAHGFSDGAITQVEKRVFDYGEKINQTDPLWQEIYRIAARIEGLPRGLGMHCGGIVITPTPIKYFVPIEKSLEGFPLMAWEKEGVEAAGFVKIDLLGNRSLAVIRDALMNLEEHGINIDTHTWQPVDDKATIEALARGDSIGVFYIESPAMRQLQKKTGKGDFEHIVIHSSIIRPAANRFIAEYVRRLKGGKWESLHPRLDNILKESYGILCYQEDVSKTAIALAGFNEADADKLRKVIAKKAGGARLAVYEKQFYDGCRENGVPEDSIQKIWAMMKSFDGYSFCKPHSASYAMVSFQSAYLRVHYPAEFMAAVISNQGGYYRPGAYISECRRMGLFLEGPDINSSRWKYYGSRQRVIIGLMAIKGLSVSGVEAILTERDRGGEYKSLEDFSRRVRPGRDDILALCPAGVFDSIANGLPRPLQARQLLQVRNEKLEVRNGELFDTHSSLLTPNSSFLTPNSLSEEYQALGFLRNVHPLALWKKEILALKYRVKAIHIGDYVGRYVKMIGWPVTRKDVWTKDGLTMAFLTLEDETDIYETVIFPQVYDKYHKLLFDQLPLLVYGLLASDEGAISLEVRRIEILAQVRNQLSSC